jgi:hypothetical protein
LIYGAYFSTIRAESLERRKTPVSHQVFDSRLWRGGDYEEVKKSLDLLDFVNYISQQERQMGKFDKSASKMLETQRGRAATLQAQPKRLTGENRANREGNDWEFLFSFLISVCSVFSVLLARIKNISGY